MSFLKTYFFTGSAGKTVSAWLLSTQFPPKVGIAQSSSYSAIAQSSASAWQYSSSFAGAAITCSLPVSDIYKIECTSTGSGESGSFQLYLSEAQTASLNYNAPGSGSVQGPMIYDPIGDRVIGIPQFVAGIGNYTSSVFGINPQNATVAFHVSYSGYLFWGGFYNPYSQTTWVWGAGSGSIGNGQYLWEFSGSNGVLVTSHSVSASNTVGGAPATVGNLAYMSSSNLVFLSPDLGSPYKWTGSIYDCTGLGMTASLTTSYVTSLSGFPVAAAESTGKFYVCTRTTSPNGFKIDPTTRPLVTTSLANFTSSNFGFSYVKALDLLFYENPTSTAAVVFDPHADAKVASIPGILDFEQALYDPCGGALVIIDDAAGDINYTGQQGGVCFVATGSYLPINFIHLGGAWYAAEATSNTTIWVTNYNNNNVTAMMTQHPTASFLPQPLYTNAFQGIACVAPSFQANLYSGSIVAPMSFSFNSNGTGSVAVWARSPFFSTTISASNPNGQLVLTDHGNGWNPGDNDDVDSALNVHVTQSGVWTFILTASNNTYGAGGYEFYLSPGFDGLALWSGSTSTNMPLLYITSSNVVCIVDDFTFDVITGVSSSVTFYQPLSGTLRRNYFDTTYGGVYSPVQDKVFVLGFSASFSSQSVMVMDHTGSFLSQSIVSQSVFYNAYVAYDSTRDHMFIMSTQQNPVTSRGRYAIYDCATQAIVNSGSALGIVNSLGGPPFNCTYSQVDDSFYVSMGGNVAMLKINASNLVSSSTSASMFGYIQYVSGSKNLIWGQRHTGFNTFGAFDPTSSTIVYNGSDPGWAFGGGFYDTCAATTAIFVDDFGSPNACGVICMNAQFTESNFIAVNNQFTDNASDSMFTYGIVYSPTGSLLFAATFDSFNERDYLWSCDVSLPTGSIKRP